MSLRIALVTGASRGMGRAIALRLADDVSGVAVHYLTRREEAQELAAAIREALLGKGDRHAMAERRPGAGGMMGIGG